MPVAKYLVSEHFNEINSKNSMLVSAHEIESWARSLSALVRETCLPQSINSHAIKGAPADSGGNINVQISRLMAEASIRSKNERVDRIHTLKDLADLEKRASTRSEKPGTDEVIALHEDLKELLDEVTKLALADVDPQNIKPFEETDIARSVRANAIKSARDSGNKNPGTARLAANEAMDALYSTEFSAYIDQTFPEKETPPTLSHSDLRALGFSYYRAFSNLKMPLSDDEIASSIAKTMSGGKRCGRWDSNIENFITPEFWKSQIESSFQEPAEYRDLRRIQASDIASPVEVLKAVRANSQVENFPTHNVTIDYLSTRATDEDHKATLEALCKPLKHNHIYVLPDPSDRDHPVVVRALSAKTSNIAQVIKQGHNSQNVILPESASEFEKLEAILDCAEELKPIMSPTVAAIEAERLWEKWRNIPLQSPEVIRQERNEITSAVYELAAKLPPPGFGGKAQEEALAKMVTVLMLNNDTASPNQTLKFRPPQGLGTLGLDMEPSVCAYKVPGDTAETTHITIKTREGEDHHYQNVPNEEVTNIILNHHLEEGGILGVSTNVQGLACYITNDLGELQVIGHWMGEEDKVALLEHAPLALTNRESTSFKPLFGPSSDEIEQRTDDWIASATALALPPETNDLFLELAIESAAYDAEIPLKIENESLMESPKASLGRFVVQELIDEPESLRLALMQRVAMNSEINELERTELVKRLRFGDWEDALSWAHAALQGDGSEAPHETMMSFPQ